MTSSSVQSISATKMSSRPCFPWPSHRHQLSEESWLDEFVMPQAMAGKESFDALWTQHPEEFNQIKLFGKLVTIPRWQRSYGRDYKFSGVVSKGHELPDVLKPYLSWVNSLGYGEFNEVLVNWYQDGAHYIGSHADDEQQLKPDSPIVTITLCLPGIPRKFRIRDKTTKEILEDFPTTNGFVLVMGGKFQKEYKHEIVRMTGSQASKAGARISLTFRQFN